MTKQNHLFGCSHTPWLNATYGKMKRLIKQKANLNIGFAAHKYCAQKINDMERVGDNTPFSLYINTAIKHCYDAEVTLYCGKIAGTIDSLKMDIDNNTLYIHELKTSRKYDVDKAITQMRMYAALYFINHPDHLNKNTKVMYNIYDIDGISDKWDNNKTDNELTLVGLMGDIREASAKIDVIIKNENIDLNVLGGIDYEEDRRGETDKQSISVG